MKIKKILALGLVFVLLCLCGCSADLAAGYRESFSEAFSEWEEAYMSITIPEAVIEASRAGVLLHMKENGQQTYTSYGAWLRSGEILTLQKYLGTSGECTLAMEGIEGEAAVSWLGDMNPYAALSPRVNGLPTQAVTPAEAEPAAGSVVYIAGYHPGTVTPVVHAAILTETEYVNNGETYLYVKSPLPVGDISFGMLLDENGALLGLLSGYFESAEASTCFKLSALESFIEGLPQQREESSEDGIPVLQVVGMETDSVFVGTELTVGDVIYAIDGDRVEYLTDIQAKKDAMAPGDTVTFTCWRLTETENMFYDVTVTFPVGIDVVFGLTVQEMVAVMSN